MPKLVNRSEFKPTVFQGMVTVSPAMLAFFALLTKVAATEASILMRGETGTGKELAAQAIHALSRRAKGPFNAVNCATMEAQARDALIAHSWPGNVRELRNVVEYASAIGDGDILRVSDLPPELRGERSSTAKSPTLGDIERQRILDALENTRGQRGEASVQLGMARSTLWRKIREYGIVSPIAERGKR